MRKLNILVLVISSLVAGLASATTVKNLYKAAVPVISRDVAVRAQGLQRALQQVLIKVSGNQAITQLPAIKSSLKTAGKLVQQYGYSEHDADLMLDVEFQANTITELLQQADQGVWGNERPLLVAWIAVKNDLGARLIATEATPDLAKTLLKQAQLRGLPLSLPLLDLEDMNILSATQINNLNIKLINQASKRYAAAGILIGQLEQINQSRWQANWILLYKGERLSWQEDGDSFAAVAKAGLGDVTDNLASRFVVLDDGQDTHNTVVRVGQINSVTDYNKVLKYLQELTGVKRVQVLQVAPRAVTFQIETGTSEQAIIQAIALNSTLMPTAAEAVMTEDGTLDYQLTI